MYKSYSVDFPRSTIGAVTVICFGLMASMTAESAEQMTMSPKADEKPHTSYVFDDRADRSFSGFTFATAQSSLTEELDAFWSAVDDGSVFNISDATSARLDRLLQVRPNLADFI